MLSQPQPLCKTKQRCSKPTERARSGGAKVARQVSQVAGKQQMIVNFLHQQCDGCLDCWKHCLHNRRFSEVIYTACSSATHVFCASPNPR